VHVPREAQRVPRRPDRRQGRRPAREGAKRDARLLSPMRPAPGAGPHRRQGA
jgi:hypothetical protein